MATIMTGGVTRFAEAPHQNLSLQVYGGHKVRRGVQPGRSVFRRRAPGRRTRRRAAISSSWVPCSTIRPSSSTTMRSASRIVDRRWAITSAVRPASAVVERRLDGGLVLVVEVAGGLVEDHDRRVLQQQPGDGQALLLAAAQPVATLADHGVVAVGQLARRCRGSAPRGTRRRTRHRWRRAWRSAGWRRSMSWNRCGSWTTTPIAARSDSCVSSRARRGRRPAPRRR